MRIEDLDRRDFLKYLLGGVSMVALDWSALPKGALARLAEDEFDAVIIGSGLGGLACAAAFSRQGFRPLVLEKHDRAGGYATSFKRPGGFEFDVSLHSTTVGERDGLHNLIPGFPEITDVEFVPHTDLYRAVFPEHDFRVPQKNLDGYAALLTGSFPGEAEGIKGIIADMKGLQDDISRFSAAGGQVDMSRFPMDYPHLFRNFSRTWGQMVDARITDPKLKAIVSVMWGYYGLPPSRLSSFYYALPTIGYLENGGYYPRGRSQTISQAFVEFIEKNGGKVLLKTEAEKILVKDGAAYGVLDGNGKTYKSKVVVSNADAFRTFRGMIEGGPDLAEYLARLDGYSVSLSCFQVFLGLKKDVVGQAEVKDSEIFVAGGYDPEAEYEAARAADVEGGGYGLTLYDNLFAGYSPKGKNTLNILTLQGYDHWEKFAADYSKGEKAAYRAEKERMARILIEQVEKKFLPGLSGAIEVMEIGTPLTNVRYTGNHRGAVYGFDQTMDNSGNTRLPHKTPVKNLYLSGAWTSPGHGYSAVLGSGLQCFGEIMKEW
jgi:phytoene dehydrogenase-like protein